jgi:hypothetical protein
MANCLLLLSFLNTKRKGPKRGRKGTASRLVPPLRVNDHSKAPVLDHHDRGRARGSASSVDSAGSSRCPPYLQLRAGAEELSPEGPKRSGGGAQRLDHSGAEAIGSCRPDLRELHLKTIALRAIETRRFSMIVSSCVYARSDWNVSASATEKARRTTPHCPVRPRPIAFWAAQRGVLCAGRENRATRAFAVCG